MQQVLDFNKPKSDLRKLDGTNYGCPYTGYYDQPLALLQKLLVRNEIFTLAIVKISK